MVRSELIRKIAEERPDVSHQAVEAAVNTIFKTIETTLARGQRVEIRGFGVFLVSPRSARVGRNPRNGGAISIPDKQIPRFKQSSMFHDRLNPLD